jgi:hypothetical protein
MANKVNVGGFLNILQKATLNYSIDNVGMNFSQNNYNMGMKGSNCIVILKGDNDIISGIKKNDTWCLNFYEPIKNVKSYFDIIDPDENDQANIIMKNEKVIIKSGKQKSQLFFCSEHLITSFTGNGPKTNGDKICEFQINDAFIDAYSTIKKIAGSFGKIYFSVEKTNLFMEATDKQNSFSNGMKIEIGKSDYDYDDFLICFDFKNFNNVMTLLNGDWENFIFRIGYVVKSQGGLISFIKNDENEKYYLTSIRENI